MDTEYNEKGKYFTEVVSKVSVPAVIQTVMHRIEGFIHVRVDDRVKTELDRGEPFLAVTEARVFTPEGTLLYSAAFLSVARSQIIWVIPNDADMMGHNQ
jgi:hypothetical protein